MRRPQISHRFSAVELLIALALLFLLFPFVEEVKGGDLIVSLLLSLVLLSASLVAQTPTGAIVGTVSDPTGAVVPNAKVTITERATGRIISHRPGVTGKDRRQVDKSFPARSGSSCRLPDRGACPGCFCCSEFTALRLACTFGKHRSTLCEHFRLPHARFDVDNGLLAC